MARSETRAAAATADLTLVAPDGSERAVSTAAAPTADVSASFLCASGERWGGAWRGVPVAWLIERVPDGGDAAAATHLRVHGAGDHVACVSLPDALAGVLATERRDGRLDPADAPRFVAPGVVAARTVKGVTRLELRALRPGEEPEEHERLAVPD